MFGLAGTGGLEDPLWPEIAAGPVMEGAGVYPSSWLVGLHPCRILCSVLLSAAVIVVRPVLIIEVDTHWRQVKGIKSYLTLSGGSRSHGQTSVDVTLLMSFCWCHSDDVHCECHLFDVTLSKFISWFHFIDINLKISLYWCHFIDVSLLMSLCWCQSVDVTL